MIKYLVLISLMVLLPACASSQKENPPIIENPYLQSMQDFTHLGIEAMQQERWKSASHAFERALKRAKLINDPAIISRSWYNLAMAYKAESKMGKSKKSLQKTLSLAHQHHLLSDEIRAKLQFNLIKLAQDEPLEKVDTLPADLPVDIYLMAGTLAYQQDHKKQAKELYLLVMSASSDDRLGLFLRAQASMGLALLAKTASNAQLAKNHALKTLNICRQIGQARLSAHASLLLANLAYGVSEQEALDYAQRAKDIYILLHDRDGEKKSEVLLQKLLGDHKPHAL